MQVASINASGHKYGEVGNALATIQQKPGCLVAMAATLSVHAFLVKAGTQ